MSQVILALAEQVLAQPIEKPSREAVAAAPLLAHVAWNRAVDPLGGDQVGQYRKVLTALKDENPKCFRELKSTDWEALIQELVLLKKARHPGDDRIIRLCGLTEKNTVRVEWHQRGIEGTNWLKERQECASGTDGFLPLGLRRMNRADGAGDVGPFVPWGATPGWYETGLWP